MNTLLGGVIVACFLPSAASAGTWTGKASYYSGYKGRTASGSPFLQGDMTAAHRTLPFGTFVKVTNLDNGHSAVLIVNDRGPFVAGRVIDVSLRAADVLAFRKKGVARVRVDTIEK
jgi:rare lipoprotein A